MFSSCRVNELIYKKHLTNNGKFRMVALLLLLFVTRLTTLLSTILIILKFFITMQLLNVS